MRGSAPRSRLDALASRLSRRTGVPIEVASAVVGDEAERLERSCGGRLRWTRLKRAVARRLREVRIEEEVEHETVPTSQARKPDEVAMDAWRRQSWLE